jgi:transposase
MGWGEIAKKYGLKVGTINAAAKKVENGIKKDLSPKAMKGKPEKLTKPEKEKSGKMAEPVKPEKPMKSHK